jgi:hypothetical protein
MVFMGVLIFLIRKPSLPGLAALERAGDREPRGFTWGAA